MSDTTDPTFYRSPSDAIAAAPESLAYIAAFDPAGQAKHASTVVNCDPASSTYSSVDDRWLYVSCWGTSELKQFDVSEPFHPRETASVRLGGIVRARAAPGVAWPAAGGRAADG